MLDKQMILEVVAKTDTGLVREANEDNFIVTNDYRKEEWILKKGEYTNSEAGTLLVVADGMGGLNAGEVASKIVVGSIQAYFSKKELGNTIDENVVMANALKNAHEEIIKHSNNFPETEGMGSTAIIALIKDSKVHVCWVGDSRCYLIRNKKIMQLSKDHSYVQSLVDDGKLTMEQAFHHPDSNIITQSMGDKDRYPKPDYNASVLMDNDILLLCSDGLNGMLEDAQINSIINENDTILQAVDQLIENANLAGGIDNISIVIAKIISGANGQEFDASVKDSAKNKRSIKQVLIYSSLFIACIVTIILLALNFSARSSANKKNTPGSVVVTNDSSQKNKNEINMANKKDTDVSIQNKNTIVPKDDKVKPKDLPDKSPEKFIKEKEADQKQKIKEALTPIINNDKEKNDSFKISKPQIKSDTT